MPLIQQQARHKPLKGPSAPATFGLELLAGVVFRTQDLAASFIVESLDKTATLSGRTFVRGRTISLMDDDYVLFGHGTNAVRLLSFNGLMR